MPEPKPDKNWRKGTLLGCAHTLRSHRLRLYSALEQRPVAEER